MSPLSRKPSSSAPSASEMNAGEDPQQDRVDDEGDHAGGEVRVQDPRRRAGGRHHDRRRGLPVAACERRCRRDRRRCRRGRRDRRRGGRRLGGDRGRRLGGRRRGRRLCGQSRLRARLGSGHLGSELPRQDPSSSTSLSGARAPAWRKHRAHARASGTPFRAPSWGHFGPVAEAIGTGRDREWRVVADDVNRRSESTVCRFRHEISSETARIVSSSAHPCRHA